MPERVAVLLTTYNRTELALRTIRGILDYFQYPDWFFLMGDDGSEDGHLSRLVDACGEHFLDAYNSGHRGVGHNSNWGLRRAKELGAEIVLLLEDDWELRAPFDAIPHVNLLTNHSDIGMIRLGYLSYGPRGEIITREGKLWLKFRPYPEYQFTYAGHAHLLHSRFHDTIGYFSEGLAPGANELDFCGKVNRHPDAPAIVWCLDYGTWGPFAHIGSQSLADIEPNK